MTHEHERSTARRCAAQMLYSSEIRNTPSSVLLENSEYDCLETPVSDYALELIAGIEANKAQLDEMLESASTNWKLDRMPLMDLNILRIALFEMLHKDQIPISVSINEAVELAKSFGGEDDSPRFVNGLLGNIARQIEGEASADVTGVDVAEGTDEDV